MVASKDYFSGCATDYAAFRPHYPDALPRYLASCVPQPETAWDAGCGSRQLSQGLARYLSRVVATDLSAQQLEGAYKADNIQYYAAPAEASGLDDASIDLAVSAQAAHWFDLPRYYVEVSRVLKPGGLLALVGYQTIEGQGGVGMVLRHFYSETLRGYWPPERQLVEQRYQSLPFPFAETPMPGFHIDVEWTLEALLGYVRSWSAVGEYRKATGKDAVREIEAALGQEWRQPEVAQRFHFPVFVRGGYKPR